MWIIIQHALNTHARAFFYSAQAMETALREARCQWGSVKMQRILKGTIDNEWLNVVAFPAIAEKKARKFCRKEVYISPLLTNSGGHSTIN